MISLCQSRFTDILPDNLAGQTEVQALAYAVGNQIARLIPLADGVRVYAAVDTMGHAVLDYLATELQVFAYRQSYALSVKREMIRTAMLVAARLGTSRAVETIVSAFYPLSTVEEWYAYGGEPYHFRIVLDVSQPAQSIDNAELRRVVGQYKALRAHLEDSAVVYQSRSTAAIITAWGAVAYEARRCGTWPSRSTYGHHGQTGVQILPQAGNQAYSAPRMGKVIAGTVPGPAKAGGLSDQSVFCSSSAAAATYAPIRCGAARL